MTALWWALATVFSTSVGGLLALRLRDRLHVVLSFTAGVLLGVVAFDILPEIFRLVRATNIGPSAPMIALVGGFLLFHSIERFVLVHQAHEADYVAHHHPHVGVLSAVALVGHSFLDGVGIGLAFQVSAATGLLVAVAVISHDFSDGLNTVGLMLVNRNPARRALAMLLLDALAPLGGVTLTLLVHVPQTVVVVYLGFFAGFLLYIGAADVLPEAHSGKQPGLTLGLIGLTCFGAALMFAVTRVV